ncbi:hypothetical protein NEIRO03_0209 [Nematocida sp. AWRm78]|nr:hypothetical protein NEIRO02_0210 [Nematocida sp. AWRm79]KAI5182545.1 hypothetical protein NEIRO03_0209 [Nematocida sp. AWRm78]
MYYISTLYLLCIACIQCSTDGAKDDVSDGYDKISVNSVIVDKTQYFEYITLWYTAIFCVLLSLVAFTMWVFVYCDFFGYETIYNYVYPDFNATIEECDKIVSARKPFCDISNNRITYHNTRTHSEMQVPQCDYLGSITEKELPDYIYNSIIGYLQSKGKETDLIDTCNNSEYVLIKNMNFAIEEISNSKIGNAYPEQIKRSIGCIITQWILDVINNKIEGYEIIKNAILSAIQEAFNSSSLEAIEELKILSRPLSEMSAEG